LGNNLVDSVVPSLVPLVGEPWKFPYNEGNPLIVAVEYWYFGDDSGTHAGARWCVVSGYIGTAKQWDRLRRDWRDILRRFHVEEFHSTSFFQGRSPYRAWGASKRDSFLSKLIAAVNQRKLRPIGTIVDVETFNNYTLGERRVLTGGAPSLNGKLLTSGAPKNPYFVALQGVIAQATLRVSDESTVHFILDSQGALENRVHETFEEIKQRMVEKHRSKLGNLTFAESKKEPAVQAADLNAFSWSSFKERGSTLLDGRRHTALWGLTAKEDGIQLITKTTMEGVLNQQGPEARARMQGQK